jgi:hypothetical protein
LSTYIDDDSPTVFERLVLKIKSEMVPRASDALNVPSWLAEPSGIFFTSCMCLQNVARPPLTFLAQRTLAVGSTVARYCRLHRRRPHPPVLSLRAAQQLVGDRTAAQRGRSRPSAGIPPAPLRGIELRIDEPSFVRAASIYAMLKAHVARVYFKCFKCF